MPILAQVAQLVVAGEKVAALGLLAATDLRAALSAAFQVRVTGAEVELTDPVRRPRAGLVEKVGAVVSPTRATPADRLVVPRTWVARTWTVCVPAPTLIDAEVAVPPACAATWPSTRTSKPEITVAGVVVVQL